MAASEWRDAVTGLDQLCLRAVSAALTGIEPGLRARLEIGVLLTDDEAVRVLNRDFRGKDSPTNVLSFPAQDLDGDLPPEGPVLLGDIVVAFGTVRREAEASGIALEAHLTHLLIHGALHLLGFDHQDDEEAEVMEARETLLMRELGLADPYAAADAAGGLEAAQ